MRSTETLLGDLKTTQTDVDAFEPHVKKLDDSLTSVIDVLNKSKEVADKVDELDDDLKTTSVILTGLCAVPAVDEIAGPLNTAVSDMEKSVKPVRNKIDAFEKKVKPVRDKLKEIDKYVRESIQKLNSLKEGAAKLSSEVSCVNDCAEEIHSDVIKGSLDKFSSATDPVVKTINSALERATTLSERIEEMLQKIENACNVLLKIETPVINVLNVLDKLKPMFDAINSVLNQKISVPYSVKIKVHVSTGNWWKPWAWGWKIKTVNFSFSVKQIFDGINTGIGWINDKLMDLAKTALNALHIKFPELPSIPGLDDALKAIENTLSVFDPLIADVEELESQFESMLKNIHALEVAVTGFSIPCSKD
jgi:uncharacterized coiled-coil DUF342 family protein